MNEIAINNAETTKVALKTSFSKPRLVNDEEPPPKLLEKPVPLDCIKIITISAALNIICKINNMFCIRSYYTA